MRLLKASDIINDSVTLTYFTSERITPASGSPEIAPNSSKFSTPYLNNHLVDDSKTQYSNIPMPSKLPMETVKQLYSF